ncbi:hypothetical protein ACIBI9_64275 [Nonomuraea sp. NPDC050451]|uniref:Orn/Lys/Arg family decarboxylase n=1 Tax=Nonomuraea sp. NPDC050451 TaxID=3364364 RepID=UPI0037A2BFEC
MELLTPYPPGIPAVLPGERLTDKVLRYLHSGTEGGLVIPDAADVSLNTAAWWPETVDADPRASCPVDADGRRCSAWA